MLRSWREGVIGVCGTWNFLPYSNKHFYRCEDVLIADSETISCMQGCARSRRGRQKRLEYMLQNSLSSVHGRTQKALHKKPVTITFPSNTMVGVGQQTMISE